ncbi:MAG: sigma-54 dependent transcriptional regulator [Gammaproteobacteria bacterium]|nr:sigma-54 dependent transcriptional regulator [Gammaproteobacteria bacterium]
MDKRQSVVLFVDDEPDIRKLIKLTLERMGVCCDTADCLKTAHQLLAQKQYDFCLTDMRLPDGDGLQLVQHIRNLPPKQNMPIAVITAHGNIDTAVSALKLGAFDFVSKPVDLERLRSLMQLALRLNKQDEDTSSLETDSLLLGNADNMQELRSQIAKVAHSDAPVHISGESGSGKELAARSIHLQGARADKPFVAINCGAIPGELMESEFFGYQKGSFTGAYKDKPGLFQAASGGTLFLDEVADLPLHMQVKLLRAIQEKSIRPTGSSKEIPTNVRIVSATHKNLNEEVAAGRFRSDLFYRINVIEISIPSLRQRNEDIPLLAKHIMQRIAENSGRNTPEISPQALEILTNAHLPGNVRQLENILERALTLCDDGIIYAKDLMLEPPAKETEALAEGAHHNLAHENKKITETSTEQFAANDYDSLDDFLEGVERQTIESVLADTRWNRTAAAEKLGISFRSLRYRLKKLGFNDE